MVPEYTKLWRAYRDLSDRLDELSRALLAEQARRAAELDIIRAHLRLVELKIESPSTTANRERREGEKRGYRPIPGKVNVRVSEASDARPNGQKPRKNGHPAD